ncbi:hypothetical protein RND71_026152 [Anisodus tanguticus]|uniref:MADS-box domain-containing protein n=1 Tax=Anisodus tanguticus TaxID=243964 RepID=A0AAE1RNB0_9SOLA|nr:hypothetical protein RND71_026152 [Anisodus tanguticus]
MNCSTTAKPYADKVHNSVNHPKSYGESKLERAFYGGSKIQQQGDGNNTDLHAGSKVGCNNPRQYEVGGVQWPKERDSHSTLPQNSNQICPRNQVPSESQRKAKKIASLSKQAKELSSLCDIHVAVIVCSHGETIPSISPNEDEARVIINRYLSHSEEERSKKLITLETYLSKKLVERENYIRKIEEKKIEIIFNQLYEADFNLYKLNAQEIKELLKLSALTQAKLEERKKELDQQFQISQPPSLLSNFEPATEGDVGHISSFHVGL